MARGGRLPRAAGRPPRFLRTGHRCAIGVSEAHLRLRGRDARHTLEGDAEGVLESLLFHRASRDLRPQGRHFASLAEGDPNVDAALASAMGCSPLPRSLTPPRPPLSDQRAVLPRLSGSDSQPAPILDTPHTTGVPCTVGCRGPGRRCSVCSNPSVGSRLSAPPALTVGGAHRSSRIRLFLAEPTLLISRQWESVRACVRAARDSS